MKKGVEKPNLPTGAVTLCALGEMFDEVAETLEKRNVAVLKLAIDKRLRYTTCHHADMLICHLGGERVVCGSKQNFDRVGDVGLLPIEAKRTPQPSYPSDVHLNQLIVGDFAAGLRGACDPAVLEGLAGRLIEYHDIRQGYAKCSAAVVAQSAIITSDYTVAKSAFRWGIDVLVIRPGHIELPDYDHGFIGGVCGLIAPDRLAVAGDINTHPDGDKIIDFLGKYGVTADPLFGGALKDIGGILPLCEQ